MQNNHRKPAAGGFHPGRIVLFGSGETSSHGGAVFEYLAQAGPRPLQAAVLETPAGFELNSAHVAGRIADFLKSRLQNYQPEVRVIPARHRHSPFGTQNPVVLEPLMAADLLFMGPGSPTYAVRQLRDTLAWHMLQACHRQGAALVCASAAAVAVGAKALPVYEIFKVGDDPHWIDGLDLLGPYHLDLVIVPHWNNAEGGPDVDTSHCFIGAARFAQLVKHLPSGLKVVGIDELTALLLDLDAQTCQVMGSGKVHLLCAGEECTYGKGESFPLDHLGPLKMPDPLDSIPEPVWQKVAEVRAEARARARDKIAEIVPERVQFLAAQRLQAREQKEWARADALRAEIAALGWNIKDTPGGVLLERLG